MQSGTKVTIRDVAAAAETSVATVSRVLSDSGYPVSQQARERVLKAVEDLGYTPNLLARMLKSKQIHEVGVILPTLQNHFYVQILMGIERMARKSNHDILIYTSGRNAASERELIGKLYQKQVKGLLISSIDSDPDMLRQYMANGGRVVQFDQYFPLKGSAHIRYNFSKAGHIATTHLLACGHRHIAFASSPLTIRSRRDNFAGYCTALAEYGCPLNNDYILVAEHEEEADQGMYEFNNGKLLAQRMLALPSRPSAVFAVNDLTALGMIQAFTASGLRVPEDVSVVGLDNLDYAQMSAPPLTTVRQPSYETGQLAFGLLLDMLAGKPRQEDPELEPLLIERSSVRRI